MDLDPAPEVKWKSVVEAAFLIKNTLAECKLESFVKSTGGKGLHVVVPILPEYSWKEVKIYAQTLVQYLVSQSPKKYTATIIKSKRANKIFIDYLRNQKGATAIAPYSTRALPDATVAVPLHWEELTHRRTDTIFTIKTVLNRLDLLKKDPWQDFFKMKQSLKLNKL